MNAPDAPPPMETAQAQAGLNESTAVTQAQLAATNQRTPYGNLTYDQIGTWDDGTPRFQATTSLSPEQQGLYDRLTQAQTQFGDIANTQLGRVADTLSTPWDFNAETANNIVDMQRQFLDPEWSQRQGTMDAQLAARGLSPGGQAYSDRTREFGDARNRAYDAMYLDAYRTAGDMAQRERNQPLTELTSMLSMTQPQSPQFTNTPQPGVAPVDYSGLVTNNYNQEVAQHNAMMGGMFDIASAVGGGWARSDRRLKTDSERIGTHPRGFGVYSFRYLWDTPGVRRVGVMADEVAPVLPEAVSIDATGFAMVDYGMLRIA